MEKSIKPSTKLEVLIKRVHEMESKRMGISIPLEFEKGSQGYMATTNYYATQGVLGNIIDIDAAHSITYCAEPIQKLINSLLFTKRARKVCSQYVVLHTVRHELRHVWQTMHNKEILMRDSFHLDALSGYGQRPQEADANQYAESINVGKFNVILQSCTLNQDMVGRVTVTKEDNEKAKRILRNLLVLNFKLAIGLIK